MKEIIALLCLVFCILQTSAAPANQAPVSLAIISESPGAVDAVDLLTAEFTKKDKVRLLERAEIERVYREQGLSAENQNYVKLGKILGADGLLLVDVAYQKGPAGMPMFGEPPEIVTARMIAVKPGVILTYASVLVSRKDMPAWSESFAIQMGRLLPKLEVSATDAIPISVVNLRSAIQSDDGKEIEHQLKSLAIQRLSAEPQFFVLERQRMQLLSREKDLKSDESAFWNGSYLLEGTIDQNGFSKAAVTIDVRLTPPKGGEPVTFQVSGNRTNLAEVIDAMAAKITEALKINSAVKPWNAADEAAQYFSEAQWAARWKLYSEAQMDADSAWALGKQDLDCALVRIRACVAAMTADIGDFHHGETSMSPASDSNGLPAKVPHEQKLWDSMIHEIATNHPLVSFKVAPLPRREAVFVWSDTIPSAENIAQAEYGLRLYLNFIRKWPDEDQKTLWRGKGWNGLRNSDWYQLGIEDLVAASKVLQRFNIAPEAQTGVADELAELRALARSTAETISKAPSIHNSYFVGDRMVNRDELAQTMNEQDNIFHCETVWGCYWQEKPEGSLALYRELLASPVFCYLHYDFWHRNFPAARLAAWNKDDQDRIPMVWSNFLGELAGSTNVLWQMEAKALATTDATSEPEAQAAKDGWWSLVRSNRQELVANNVELFYLGWGGFASNPETEAMDQEYGERMRDQRDHAGRAADFEKQKEYLANAKTFDLPTLNRVFLSRSFTKAQAAELKPLVDAYKSNLLAQALPPGTNTSQTASFSQFQAQNNVRMLEFFLESKIDAALHAAEAPTAPPVQRQPAQPPPAGPPSVPVAVNPAPPKAPYHAPELVTNVLPITKFMPIPLEGLPGDKLSAVTITAHHWLEGKLLLDFIYNASIYTFDARTNWQNTRNATLPAIAILDPETEHWTVISCPEPGIADQTHLYHHTTLLHGELYSSDGGQIREYDFRHRLWQTLACSSGKNCELFTVNDRLYAASQDLIFEIVDNGKSTRILASSRRRPPVSALDTRDFDAPAMFAGSSHSLRVSACGLIFSWAGGDWRQDADAPATLFSPEIFPEGVLFRHSSANSVKPNCLTRLLTGAAPELCIGPQTVSSPPNQTPPPSSRPIWRLPAQMFLENLAAALSQSNLYLLAGHSEFQKSAVNQHGMMTEKAVGMDGYNAALFCYSPDLPLPQKVFLNFDAPGGCPPLAGVEPAHAGFPGLPPALLVIANGNLLCASESPVSRMPIGFQRLPPGCKAGIWMVSLSRLAPVIAAQKQAQLAKAAQAAMAAERVQKNLLAKYDLNHNGVLDPDERENALDDPDFIKASLDEIDADHNGWLGARELAWFDANQNKILDHKEMAGIHLAEKLLVDRLLDQFDHDKNGWLDMREYEEMLISCLQVRPGNDFDFHWQLVDLNHDNHLDADELASLMQRHLATQLRPPGRPGPLMHFPVPGSAQLPTGYGRVFKATVETYWQNPGGMTIPPPMNLPSMGHRFPPGAGNP